jgi:hypothetical protein
MILECGNTLEVQGTCLPSLPRGATLARPSTIAAEADFRWDKLADAAVELATRPRV